jgi:exodeoxyribonuclease V gamma subunit
MYSDYKFEDLADILGNNLFQDICDPFTPLSIVCSSKTMEQYINKTIADKQLISANNEVLFPRNAINMILNLIHNNECVTRLDKDFMQWAIFAMLPELENYEDYKTLKEYIENSKDNYDFRRYQLAVQIAGVFDTYIGYRSDWLEAWQNGELKNLGYNEKWQADLWRRLIALEDNVKYSRPTKLFSRENLHKIKKFLPERISIFGISNLPPDYIECFSRLAEIIKVDFYYLMPCIEFWGDFTRKMKVEEKANPLLVSLGVIGRDFLNLLLDTGWDVGGGNYELPDDNMWRSSLLNALQYDILTAKNIKENEYEGVEASKIIDYVKTEEFIRDESVIINSCYTRMREVEVLYDFILKHISSGKYQFSDIIVMAPDIEEYAPYIQAVFNKSVSDGHVNFIPFSLTDCSALYTSPEADIFLKILKLPDSLMNVNDIFEIIYSDPFMRRFEVSHNEIDIMRELLLKTHIIWGKDKTHRENILGIPYSEQNSWFFGFKRMLAGYAYDREYPINDGTLPLDIDGGLAVAAGKLIGIVEKIFEICEVLQKKYSVQEWFGNDVLYRIINEFFEDTDRKNEETEAIRKVLELLEKNMLGAKLDAQLPLVIIRTAIEDSFKTQNSERNAFFRGNVTFCRLLPMRNIPSKIICLLGMNDSEFPRIDSYNGFDLIRLHSRAGDRSLRNDDRYIFLETIMASREILYLSYLGQSKESNEELVPSILLEELLDYLIATTGMERDYFILKHALHGYSSKYFLNEYCRFYSYSNTYCNAAKVLVNQVKHDEFEFCPSKINIKIEKLEFAFQDLVDFYISPTKFFLKQILDISLYNEELEPLPIIEPFELGNLENYNVKFEIMEHFLSGKDKIFNIASRLKADGHLPDGKAGEDIIENALNSSKELIQIISYCGTKNTTLLPKKIEYTSKNGQHIVFNGSFDDFYEQGQLFFRNAKLKGKDILKAWIWHCLAVYSGMEIERTICIGYSETVSCDFFQNNNDFDYKEIIEDLIDGFIVGLSCPLPFFLHSSEEFAKLKSKNPTAEDSELLINASNKWYKDLNSYDYDISERANVVCFGEDFPGMNEHLRDKFIYYALKVYDPLLKAKSTLSKDMDIYDLLNSKTQENNKK